eukprot:SAG22_NODE_1938_length_3288_cov_2.551270_2_plen_349_part_00
MHAARLCVIAMDLVQSDHRCSCVAVICQVMDAVLEKNPELKVVEKRSRQPVPEPVFNETYSLPDDADKAMIMMREEGGMKKKWRLNEARDFIFLMSELLRRTDAPFLGFHQDDATWTQRPELLGTPIQSLYQFRPGGPLGTGDVQLGRGLWCKEAQVCNCALGCGLVSMVFRRDLLQMFLGAIINQGAWKLKPIDQLLDDFLNANGFEWPATRSVQHKGTMSSYVISAEYLASLKEEGNKVGAAWRSEFREPPPLSPRPGLLERHRIYSCARAPREYLPERARPFCASPPTMTLSAQFCFYRCWKETYVCHSEAALRRTDDCFRSAGDTYYTHENRSKYMKVDSKQAG